MFCRHTAKPTKRCSFFQTESFRLRLAGFARASQPRQTKRRSRSIPRSTPAPHRRFSPVASRKRRRAATPFRFPIRAVRSACSPSMIPWPTWPSRGPHDFQDCGLVIVVTVSNQCPRCNRCASNSCPTLCTLKCRPSVHANVRRCATDVPLSHAVSPQMPRIESPVTTQGSRKDHARFTQGATHGSWKESALSILPASLWQRIGFSISPHLLSTLSASKKRRGRPSYTSGLQI